MISFRVQKSFTRESERINWVFLRGRALAAVVEHELLFFLQINFTAGTLKLFVEAGFGL